MSFVAIMPLARLPLRVHFPLMGPRDEQRAWLAQVIAETGIAPTTLATKAGLAPTTLTRFLNNPEHATALSARTIAAVENLTGVRYGLSMRPRLAAELEAEAFEDSGPFGKRVQSLLSGNNLVAWTLKTRALETAGFMPGDVLIVDMGEPPVPGDAVCAQVWDAKSMRAETVFRLFEPPFLHAATFDRLQSAPILVDQNVEIKGPVVVTVRPRLGRKEAA